MSGLIQQFRDETDFVVFGGGAIAIISFILAYLAAPSWIPKQIDAVSSYLYTQWAWAYLGAMMIFVVFCLYLMLGSWGDIKLGGEDAEPEHSYLTYFAMFFSAGIAAGIVFWGPAEAITHYNTVPPLIDAQPQSPEAMVGALQYTVFHWGISAWSSYVVIGLPIAYFAYNRGAPMRVSTILSPFVGVENLDDSYAAKIVDILAFFAAAGGIVTPLGFVGQQMLTGVEYYWGVSLGDAGTIATITGLTIIFTVSVATGVKRGIKRLSQLNVSFFILLAIFTFIAGPSMFVLNLGMEAIGKYLGNFVTMSMYTNSAGSSSWVGSWTIFYWAWWFAFAPVSGIFLARISKGRTVREVTFTGVVATTLATVPWFVIIGGTSMHMQANGTANIIGTIQEYGVAVSGFPLFQALPGGEILILTFLGLVVTFFITTADSGTLGVAMLTSGGKKQPSVISRTFWGLTLGLVSSILVVIGGTSALQSAVVITGGPFAIIALIAVWGMIKEFSSSYGRVLIQEDENVIADDVLGISSKQSGRKSEVDD